MKSTISNCYVGARVSDMPLFQEGGSVKVNLDGYAIIPIEEYHALTDATGFAPDNHWPCKACGAPGPTPNGHDPCIANLPGVDHACCGHGYGRAYAMFADGRIIRGRFDPQ